MTRDILERLRQYNPPDRTSDGQRWLAVDVQDAANEIERLREQLKDAETSLAIYDETCSSHYWDRHPGIRLLLAIRRSNVTG